MEFNEKIQKIRKEKKWTQEEMAQKLYVSRTAISKWESGKGYPNIDSLIDISKLFNITIDKLLSSEEILDIASKENNSNILKNNNLISGLLDIISILFIFLPLYPFETNNYIYSVSLLNSNNITDTMKIIITLILLILSIVGILEIILYLIKVKIHKKIFNVISIIISILSVIFFSLSRQIYLTVIIFIILIIKITIKYINKNYK